MKTVIEIEKLGYSYGEGWILNDLSLKIEQGDFVAVMGILLPLSALTGRVKVRCFACWREF